MSTRKGLSFVQRSGRSFAVGANQIAKMALSLRAVYEGIAGADDAPTSCCTLETMTPSGSEVWIEALPGTVNMAYPFDEEPLELMSREGVRSPPGLYPVEWAAGEYATLGFSDIRLEITRIL